MHLKKRDAVRQICDVVFSDHATGSLYIQRFGPIFHLMSNAEVMTLDLLVLIKAFKPEMTLLEEFRSASETGIGREHRSGST